MTRGLRDLFVLGFSSISLLVAACGDDSVNNAFGDSMGDSDSSAVSASGGSITTTTSTTSSGSQSGTTLDSDSASSMTMTSTSTSDGTDSSATDSTTSDGTGSDTDGTDSTAGSTGDSTTGDPTDTDTDGDVPCDFNFECDDGLFCTGVELCVSHVCQAGIPPVCDDGFPCTVDACDEENDACIAAASDSLCDDGNYCNGPEICSLEGGCQPGTAPNCNDGVACTDDSCDPSPGVNDCVNEVNHDNCDNGSFCDGEEVCDPVLNCQPDPDWDDCNDFVPCTDDSCDDDADTCVNAPNDDNCDNGLGCDGAETCNATAGCQPGTAVVCNEYDPTCVQEFCVETADPEAPACDFSLDSGACPGSQFCTLSGCLAGTPCTDDATCDDGLACNGEESCNITPPASTGTCVPGTPVPIDDGIGCTVDSCSEPAGTPVHTANNNACLNTDPCDGVESCNPALGPGTGCQAGTPPNCDDGFSCTDDSCFAGFGCFNPPVNSRCQDDSVCNGAEVCNPATGAAVTGCAASAGPLVCPQDDVACTAESCVEGFGCVSVPDDSECDCGDRCDEELGCTELCNVATCDGKIYECGDCLDNDGDCDIDDRDDDCFGVCDNNESGFKGEIPGQNSAPCKMDCYFDNDSGSGNDDCYWSHECDPLEPSLLNNNCEYDPNANTPGTNLDCDELLTITDPGPGQSAACLSICGPVVPNGCDCFGCCEVTLGETTRTIFLGTEDAAGNGTCNSDVFSDTALCRECTQVQSCLNPCETCEICFGQDTLPPECGNQQECGEAQPCGLPGQSPCAPGEFCLTGCCTSF